MSLIAIFDNGSSCNEPRPGLMFEPGPDLFSVRLNNFIHLTFVNRLLPTKLSPLVVVKHHETF